MDPLERTFGREIVETLTGRDCRYVAGDKVVFGAPGFLRILAFGTVTEYKGRAQRTPGGLMAPFLQVSQGSREIGDHQYEVRTDSIGPNNHPLLIFSNRRRGEIQIIEQQHLYPFQEDFDYNEILDVVTED